MDIQGYSSIKGAGLNVRNLFNVNKIREDFPILNLTIRGKQLVYLDNAATTQKPQLVIQTINDYYNKLNSNINRGVHFLSEQATIAYETARKKVKDYINASAAQEIIFVRGATEAINLVAYSFGRSCVKEGDEIIISAMEHHANIVPWQILCHEKNAILRIIPMNNDGELLLDELDEMINERTKIVAVVQVSNSLGTVNPIKAIIEKAHARGVPVLIDGSQAIPHHKIDVQALGCDFYVFSGHKLFGPTGIGVLYGKLDLLESMPPYQTGGDMIKLVTFKKTTFNDLPYKFEAGTQNIEGAIGMGAAIDYLRTIPFQAATEHEMALLRYAQNKLAEIETLRIIGTAANKAPVISFVLDDIHPHDIGTSLDSDGIAIRTGHHCTQPIMQFFNVPATARVSLCFYNTIEEVDKLVDSVKKMIDKRNRSQSHTGSAAEVDDYQQTIMEHDRKPSNNMVCFDCNHRDEGFNPFCGDHIVLYVKLEKDVISNITFQGELCAISKSSASMMTEALKGKTISEAEKLFGNFQGIFNGHVISPDEQSLLGELAAFNSIKDSPARIKCANLPWQTMKSLLHTRKEAITSEL